MTINDSDINKHNIQQIHQFEFALGLLKSKLGKEKYDNILKKVKEFQVIIPVGALGSGYSHEAFYQGAGEPRNLAEKLRDIGLIHTLNRSSGSIFLHFPADISAHNPAINSLVQELGLRIDKIGFNTIQDQKGMLLGHNFARDIINCGNELGSKSLTVWVGDNKDFSRPLNFRRAFLSSGENLKEIYSILPVDWKVSIGYRVFEPHSFFGAIDWERSLLRAMKLGDKAFALVNIGQQQPTTNVVEAVSLLLAERKLGEIHFTEGNPYQLFQIFIELLKGTGNDYVDFSWDINWIVYPGYNSKDPLEDLLQSCEAIKIAYAQALLIDKDQLRQAIEANDIVKEVEILQNAFRTDVRPLLAESRLINGGTLNPIEFFRVNSIRDRLIKERSQKTLKSGYEC